MSSVIIIAEAGVNHNGSIENAKRLIELAAEAGVDYIKFQTFKATNLVSKKAEKAGYQKQNMKKDTDNSQLAMLQKLELSYDDHLLLMEHCKKHHIQFFSTAFDMDSVDLLNSFSPNIWKVPSGEITNLPYLEKIGSFNSKVILSTGMCTMQEIKDAMEVLIEKGTDKRNITILHCNTEYPTPMADVNLKAMAEMELELDIKIGYSDHTEGIEVPIAAVALGAIVIEKHFTLSKQMEGPDHKASLEPHELKQMVVAIRNIELALGNGHKTPSVSESKNIDIARKSIHLKTDLPAGHILQADDLIMKRPGDGISPMRMYEVIGKKLRLQLQAEHQLQTHDWE